MAKKINVEEINAKIKDGPTLVRVIGRPNSKGEFTEYLVRTNKFKVIWVEEQEELEIIVDLNDEDIERVEVDKDGAVITVR